LAHLKPSKDEFVARSAGAQLEAVAHQDLVTALVLFDPSQTDEAADRFVHSLT
jgi:hypothetical protein